MKGEPFGCARVTVALFCFLSRRALSASHREDFRGVGGRLFRFVVLFRPNAISEFRRLRDGGRVPFLISRVC